MPNLWLFLLTSVAITLAPGPDNMQVIARGIAQGRRAGLAAAAGFTSGCLFHTSIAAIGLAAVLRSSPWAFEGIKLAGAAYLIWIGIKAIRARGALALANEAAPQPLGAVFRQSVLANMLNPKVTLFFLVFLPQFVSADTAHPGAQMLLLVRWRAGHVAQATPRGRALARPCRRRHLHRPGLARCATGIGRTRALA